MTIARILGRVWIPLVILLVTVCGGLIVSRVHGFFGSERRPSYTDGHVGDTKPVSSKQVRYEVFGPAETVADISYYSASSGTQEVDSARLPWSTTLTVNSPSIIANLVAQGDSPSIGCRIVVDGATKAERISHEVNAYTYCQVQG